MTNPLRALLLGSVALIVFGVGLAVVGIRWLEEIDGRRVRV